MSGLETLLPNLLNLFFMYLELFLVVLQAFVCQPRRGLELVELDGFLQLHHGNVVLGQLSTEAMEQRRGKGLSGKRRIWHFNWLSLSCRL